MQEDDLAGLRARLDAHHDWPSEYMFKFIAPNLPEKVDAILGMFPGEVRVERKTSGGGKYIALTIHEVVSNADAVFHRYQTVQALGGIFAL
jgi:putative lipoic acid-binding regulatory protein